MNKRNIIKNIIVVRKIDGHEDNNVLKIYDKIILVAFNFNLTVSEIKCSGDVKNLSIPKHSLFIAIGGDGTMICAAKQAAHFGSPVIGFNIGKRGFLSDFDPSSIQYTIYAAISGNLYRQHRSMVNVCVDKKLKTALNDITISNTYSDTIIQYEIIINGYTTGNHLSNSLIISTATGSTAYSLSVGGAIIDPSANVLELIPVAPLSLTSVMRPMIIPMGYNIEIKLKPRFKSCSYSIKVDGQEEFSLDAKEDVIIKISESSNTAIFLHEKKWNFYEVLTEKLNWAKF